MVNVEFTEDALVEIANNTTFTAFHALEDADGEAWRVAIISVAILDKIESAYPGVIESENYLCAREMLVLRRSVAQRIKP